MVRAKDLVWVLFSSMFWASMAILLLGFVETKGIVNLLRIPFRILGPSIFLFATIGAYALRNNILDVWTMLLAGVAGYFLRRSEYSIPAVVMGVVLGKIGESAFSKAMVMMDYSFAGFFTKPIAGTLIALGLFTAGFNIYRHYRPKWNTRRRCGLLPAP